MMALPTRSDEIIIHGTAVSPGISIGLVHVAARGLASPEVYEIPEALVEIEIERFTTALALTKQQLNSLKNRIEKISGENEGRIFDAHLMILEDRTLIKRVTKRIQTDFQNAESAFYSVIQNYVEAMRRMNDAYLSERATDIDDICQRVIRNFAIGDVKMEPERPDHQHILIAYDLTPSDTASMDRSQVLGFATEQGSINSHTAILARSLGIPAIVGLTGAVLDVKALSHCVLDGFTGQLIINPTASTIAKYEAKQLAYREQDEREHQTSRAQKDTLTADGHKVILSTNIEFEHELPLVEECGAEGVGLFRTEFFLLNGGGNIPSEDEQAASYTEVARRTDPHIAIIRTLDAGGDKLPAEPLAEPEPNPFLGWRGIRVSLSRIEMFKEQLRAILRASAHGKVGIMFPLISGVSEVVRAKNILIECMAELRQKAIPFDEDVQIGVMIEVPSAAIMAHEIAKEVDFFSIGTNDLIQYTVAVDRVNHQVSSLYKPTNPAVIRLIKMTVDAAQDNGIWTGICGEMAGDLHLTPLLIGLGVEELSVGNHQLPKIKQAIGSLNIEECRALADEALKLSFSSEILALSQKLARSTYGQLLI